jgi:hypothetical protein
VWTHLQRIKNSNPVGRLIVQTLKKSKHVVTIVQRGPKLPAGADTQEADLGAARYTYDERHRFHAGPGCGSTVSFNPAFTAVYSQLQTETGEPTPPVAILAHELVHAYNIALGIVPRSKLEEEIGASVTENQIRFGLAGPGGGRLSRRTYYLLGTDYLEIPRAPFGEFSVYTGY